MKATYEFPCQRWLAKDEDDGQITRELYCGKGLGSKGEDQPLCKCMITNYDPKVGQLFKEEIRNNKTLNC